MHRCYAIGKRLSGFFLLVLGGLLIIPVTSAQPYPCPDLFEGHVFSCPATINVGVGLDVDTDAYVAGVDLGCPQGHGGICVSPGVEFGVGSESYETEFFRSGGGDVGGADLDYRIIKARVHGRYSFPLNSSSTVTFSPLAGPGLYYFSYSDCPFTEGCSESLFVLDVGGGVRFGPISVDAYSQLNGPNVSFRAKYGF